MIDTPVSFLRILDFHRATVWGSGAPGLGVPQECQTPSSPGLPFPDVFPSLASKGKMAVFQDEESSSFHAEKGEGSHLAP